MSACLPVCLCLSICLSQSADGDGRAVMERRIHSLVNVLSSVYHFLQEQKSASATPRLLSLTAEPPPTPSSASMRGSDGESFSGDSSESARARASASVASLAETPPLKLLGDAEVVEALWSGRQSMIRRLLRKLESVYHDKLIVETPEEEGKVVKVTRNRAFITACFVWGWREWCGE